MSGGDGAALLVIDMLNPYVIPTDAVAAIPKYLADAANVTTAT